MQTRFTLGAVRSVQKAYPMIKVIVVDDGSEEHKTNDFSRAYNRASYSASERLDTTPFPDGDGYTVVRTKVHMGHGSALDYGVDAVTTPLMLTMDNDVRIIEGGLVEEYLAKLNEDPDNIYAVGTTYEEHQNYPGHWIDPWFSLYQVAPIRQLHLSFTNFIYSLAHVDKPGFHLGTGGFLHYMLTSDTLHRPKIWKAVYYPEVDKIPQLAHLKKHPEDAPDSRNVINWNTYIDG